MENVLITLFFAIAIPLLIWGLHGLYKDVRYYLTYDEKKNR